MPYDIIASIVKLLDGDYLRTTLYDIKTMCISFSKAISNVTIAKLMMQTKFGRINTRSSECINRYCVLDTENVMLHVWEAEAGYYEHIRQLDGLKTTTMIVNGKEYPVRSHYCSECFKKFVLLGDNKNVSQHYQWVSGYRQVNVTFSDKPAPSTWYRFYRQRVEPLSDWQLRMLCIPVDYSDAAYLYRR